MYEYIKGKIVQLTPASAVVETGGVGYWLHISLQTFSALEGRDEAVVWVHFVVREDAQLFYGFATREEREVFRLLLGVSGVGGGTARMILSTFSPAELSRLISTGNARELKRVKGLGLKTAEKIIVELRDKILSAAAVGATPSPDDASEQLFDEALSALTLLGFGKAPSEKALQAILKEHPGAPVEEIIRLALKRL